MLKIPYQYEFQMFEDLHCSCSSLTNYKHKVLSKEGDLLFRILRPLKIF